MLLPCKECDKELDFKSNHCISCGITDPFDPSTLPLKQRIKYIVHILKNKNIELNIKISFDILWLIKAVAFAILLIWLITKFLD